MTTPRIVATSTTCPSNPDPDMSDGKFHLARNKLFSVCARHGSCGHLSPLPITESSTDAEVQAAIDEYPLACDSPQIFLSDTIWSDEKYLDLELFDPTLVTPRFFTEISESLTGPLDGWGIVIKNMRGRQLTIFRGTVLVGPTTAGDIHSMEELSTIVRENLAV